MQGEIGSAVNADEQKLSIGAYIPLTRVLRPLMTICSMSDVIRERAESMNGKYAATAFTEDSSTEDAEKSSMCSDEPFASRGWSNDTIVHN